MRAIVRIVLTVFDKVQLHLESLVGRARLYAENVNLGSAVRVQGTLIPQMVRGSTIVIGDRVVLCSTSKRTALGVSHPVVLRTLRPGATIEIGDDSGLSGTSICAAISVVIGRRCLIGADVLIADTDFHAIRPHNRRYNTSEADIAAAPIRIGDDVFLGARSCILKGVSIGDGAIVGCGAVVTKSVEPGEIVAGNPARRVGQVSRSN